VYGEGPTTIKAGSFQGKSVASLGASDIRYTRNKAGTAVYAIALGWPRAEVVLRSLGTGAAARPGRVEHVELLGTDQPVRWRQDGDGLHIAPPAPRPEIDYAAAFKVHLAR
jgi:alpha-L-fucosidase